MRVYLLSLKHNKTHTRTSWSWIFLSYNTTTRLDWCWMLSCSFPVVSHFKEFCFIKFTLFNEEGISNKKRLLVYYITTWCIWRLLDDCWWGWIQVTIILNRVSNIMYIYICCNYASKMVTCQLRTTLLEHRKLWSWSLLPLLCRSGVLKYEVNYVIYCRRVTCSEVICIIMNKTMDVCCMHNTLIWFSGVCLYKFLFTHKLLIPLVGSSLILITTLREEG